MKRHYVFANLTIVICAVLVALFANAAEFKSPRLRDAGFADGSKEWTIPASGWQVASGAGRGGSAALASEGSAAGEVSQRLAIEAGTRYRFGAWVKRDRPRRKGDAEPKIALRWFSWQDKFIGEAVAAIAVDNNPDDTGGWVRYEGLSPAVRGPYGDLYVALPQGFEGRIFFDDFYFFPDGGKTVGSLVSSAYRDEAAKGKVRFAVELNVNIVANPVEGLKAGFSFEGADGKTFALKPDELTADKAIVAVDVARLKQGASRASFSLAAADGKPLGEAALDFTRVAAPTPRRVTIDEYNRTIVDGKPFFPLGMFAGGLSQEQIDTYVKGPFNCILCYNPSEKAMDRCRDAGIMFIDNIKDYVPGSKWVKKGCETKEKALAELRAHVERVRNHPALLAWYTNDEAPLSQFSCLKEFNDFVHSIDANHPTYTVIDRPEHARRFAPTYDVIGMDPYPIGNNRGGIDIAHGWAAVAKEGMYGFRPMWHVPQAYNWYWHEARRKIAGDDPDLRFPTREEFKSMIWQPVAAGANGLIPYSFHDIYRHARRDEADALFGMVCEEMAEVKAHEDVLLSLPGPAAEKVPSGLAVRTYRAKDGVWVLACNLTRKPIKATLRFGERIVRPVCTIGGGVTSPEPGVLVAELPPIGVALVSTVPESKKARIVSDGIFPPHLQGVCTDGKSIWWSHQTELVRTDLEGRILARAKGLESHHGDLCVKDGVVYVAVNLGKFNTEDKADSWVYAYKGDDLAFVRRWKVPELVHGAGGMTWKGDRFYVVGGLPPTHDENYVYEYTPDFKFVKRHVLDSGWTCLGIQTADFSGGRFHFGCYGGTRKTDGRSVPAFTLVSPTDLSSVEKARADTGIGMAEIGGRMWAARFIWNAVHTRYRAWLEPVELKN